MLIQNQTFMTLEVNSSDDSSEDEAVSRPEDSINYVRVSNINNVDNIWNEIVQDLPQFIFEKSWF